MFSVPVFLTSTETLTDWPGQASNGFTKILDKINEVGDPVGEGENDGAKVGVGEGFWEGGERYLLVYM
jgi:hypothetical protein